MSSDKKLVFCPHCQIEVEAVMSPYGAGGSSVPRCTVCGSVIDDSVSEFGEQTCENDPSVALDEVSFVDESVSVPSMSGIIVTGFSPSIRQLLEDKIVEKNLASDVKATANGEEMIISVIDSIESENGNGKIDLVITDVPMPFLNGINASIGLRAIERSYPDHDLIPILFLTNKPCDDTFKKVIKYLAPAKYATLGPIDDREKLISHMNKILGLVAREQW